MKITRKQIKELFFLLVLSAAWLAIGWTVRGLRLGPEIGLIEQVRQGLQANYPEALPTTRELTYAAIRGMLRRTGDPHAALLEPEVGERFANDFGGTSGVVGMIAEYRKGEMVVTVVFPGEPADQAGLQPGDVILAVDGVEFDEFTTETEASMLIRGPIGAPAQFVVRRGDETLELSPVRKTRPIASGEMLEEGVAYLAQYQFTTNAPQMVKDILQDLLAQNPKGLIWDMRGNGGGSMDAAQQILSYFIEEGDLFSVELKGGERKPYAATGDAMAADIPLVVLVGEGTYSSAETAAVAIQEHGRGLLVGSTTHGKGSVQTTEPLLDGSMLHFTIAKWLSPSGEWLEGRGVNPDVSLTDDPATDKDEVLQYAVELLLEE